MMVDLPLNITLRPGYPDFRDLPWDYPFSEWEGRCSRLEEAPRGLSRHPVLFVNYDGNLYALKALHPGAAKKEYDLLRQVEQLRLPVVTPVGHLLVETVQVDVPSAEREVLVTQYLERSLPYRMLFISQSFERYREHLLDAIAGLLVQLHLAGIYWGDCSLSNTLYRRDAGALQAYMVDAETTEIYSDSIPPMMRFHDLEIMEENVNGDLLDLKSSGELAGFDPGIPVAETGAYIRLRYQRLWEEITREDIIGPDERYRIHERIRALNEIGFSVGDVELASTDNGDRLRLRVAVTDRTFHRDQLYGLTGMDVEEMQARQLMNEIQEIKATLTRSANRSTPLSVAAYDWLENIYSPIATQLEPLVDQHTTLAELYCQLLEHKWYLSEQSRRDVGHEFAVNNYLQKFGDNESQQFSV